MVVRGYQYDIVYSVAFCGAASAFLFLSTVVYYMRGNC